MPLVLDSAEIEDGQSVLDVACGTGVIANGAAERVGATGSVTGLDNNPAMIAVALRARAWGAVADGRCGTVFPDRSFDRVICQLGLQYFPDRPAAVREMRRVLRPGGRVVVMVWRDVSHSPGFAALVSALETNIGPEAAAVMRAPFAFGDDPQPIASLLRDAGFANVTVRARPGTVKFDSIHAFIRYQSAGSLAAHVNLTDEALLSRIADSVSAALGTPTADEPVEFPIEAHIAHGHVEG